MSSEKAVEAAARAHDAEDAAQRGEPDPWSIEGDDFAEFRSDRIASMRAALSAALPVLLEGRREEMARVIEPDGYWERLDSCNRALATVQMNDDQRRALTKVRDDELRCTAESLAKADRIIAMLGGGDVG